MTEEFIFSYTLFGIDLGAYFLIQNNTLKIPLYCSTLSPFLILPEHSVHRYGTTHLELKTAINKCLPSRPRAPCAQRLCYLNVNYLAGIRCRLSDK